MQHDDPNDRPAGGAGGAGFGGTGGSPGMGGSGMGGGGMGGSGAGSEGMSGAAGGMGGQGAGRSGMGNGGGLGDSAREGFESASESFRDQTRRAGESAEDFRQRVADRLKTGADRLRQRASGTGGNAEGRFDQMLDSDAAHRIESGLASGMESTADWVRNADLDSIRNDIENQVRRNPGRTLLVALGIGYLVGRAFGGGGKSSKRTLEGNAHTENPFGSGASTHGLH